jgi:hypothetical protein
MRFSPAFMEQKENDSSHYVPKSSRQRSLHCNDRMVMLGIKT